jgi:hypothetical protein
VESSPERLPRAYPVPGGRPPHPDGDTVPHPPRPPGPPVTRGQYLSGALVVAIILGVILARVIW